MGPFTMVVLIVMIVGIVRVVQLRHGAGPRGGGGDPLLRPGDPAETARLRDDLARLKDRVAVLERILTDNDRQRGLALEHEIEALRDARTGTRNLSGGGR